MNPAATNASLSLSSSIENVEENKTISHYTEILNRVKNAGLLKKTPMFYINRLIVITLINLALWIGLYFISTTSNGLIWLSLPVVMLLGVFSAQYGFIGHEAAHRQIFNNNKLNDATGIILANLFAGLSYSFWIRKHNRHHNKPNQIDYDPDIAIRVLSFTTESLKSKKGLEKQVSRNQGWLFPILLMFTGFDLLLDSFVSVTRKDVKHRYVEFFFMLIRQVTPMVIFALWFGILPAIGLWTAMMLTFGFFMGSAFAPNHKGMPLVPKDSKIDFFQRQVLTSRNVSSSWFKDNFMGGLNFQVEHHLFPSMSRPNLKKAQVLIKEYCKELNVPIVEMGWFRSIREVMRYLDKVGLSERDPFVCPLVATMRPRS
jgi:fatty acid desaturase